MSIYTPGTYEFIKGLAHGMLLLLALICAIYNAGAWREVGEQRNAINTVFYVGVVLVECWQTWVHWSRGW